MKETVLAIILIIWMGGFLWVIYSSYSNYKRNKRIAELEEERDFLASNIGQEERFEEVVDELEILYGCRKFMS